MSSFTHYVCERRWQPLSVCTTTAEHPHERHSDATCTRNSPQSHSLFVSMRCSSVTGPEKPALLAFKPAGTADRKMTKTDATYISPSPESRVRKGDIQHEKRQILTSPGARGGYGFHRTTISQKFASGGIAGEYSYTSDPAVIKQKHAAAPQPAPFRPAYRRKGGGPRGEFTAYEWRPRPSLPAPAEEDSTKHCGMVFKPARTAPLSATFNRCVCPVWLFTSICLKDEPLMQLGECRSSSLIHKCLKWVIKSSIW